jgi:hypothetical protein
MNYYHYLVLSIKESQEYLESLTLGIIGFLVTLSNPFSPRRMGSIITHLQATDALSSSPVQSPIAVCHINKAATGFERINADAKDPDPVLA